MSKTAKNKEKIARIQRAMKGDLPTLNQDTYRIDFIMALNYYNLNHDDKDKKKWLITYVAKTDKKFAVQLLKLDEKHFRKPGVLATLVLNGNELQEKEALSLKSQIEELRVLVAAPQEEETEQKVKPSNVVNIQDRMLEKAREFAGEFEGMIDEFILENKTFDAKEALAKMQVPGAVSRLIAPMFDDQIEELQEAINGKDAQLVEGYSNYKKPKLKKLLELYTSIRDACVLQVQVAKATRAPRKRKEKPVGVIVAKLKYLREFPDLGLKSVNPTTIVNSQELWVYNTKYRRVQVYRADGAKGLSVKGTKIIGYNPEESGSKMLRKPEVVKDYSTMSKRPLSNAYKALKTKESRPNGRINEECILLKVF